MPKTYATRKFTATVISSDDMDRGRGRKRNRSMVKLKVRAWRKYRQMTQEQLAAASGMTNANLSRIETGAQAYNRATLEALATALKCEPADLIGTFEPGSPEQNILNELRKMTPQQRERFAAMLKLWRESSAA